MEIKLLNKIALQEFIESDQFKTMPVIPISRHRAISHIHNPAAQDDDVLLLLAYLDDVLVGYLGILPDTIFLYSEKNMHCGWMSCIWVSEQYRGKRIAQQLLKASFNAWNNKLIATEFTLPAKNLYEKTGHFTALKTAHGVRLYLRSDFKKILPKKNKLLRLLKPVWTIADSTINFFGDLRFRNIPALPNNFQINIVNEISVDASVFINKQNQHNLFQRNSDSLQWMLRFPWVIKKWNDDDQTSRYHFTATDKSFDFIPVEVRNSMGNMCAFLLFAKRGNNLTLPYCFYTITAYILADIIIHYSMYWKINTCTVYHLEITRHLQKQKMHILWKKTVNRSYLISKDLFRQLEDKEIHLQDGDGDSAFT